MILCRKDYARSVDSNVFPGIQGGPLMHVIAAKAVALKEAQQPSFHQYQEKIIQNTGELARGLQRAGFRLVSGGTDNHLLLVDLRSKGVTGKAAAEALERAGICCNRNLIPFDPASAMVTSGLRLGAPALTTRGMGKKEMGLIAGWIGEVVDNIEDDRLIAKIRNETRELCRHFPVYPGLAELWQPR